MWPICLLTYQRTIPHPNSRGTHANALKHASTCQTTKNCSHGSGGPANGGRARPTPTRRSESIPARARATAKPDVPEVGTSRHNRRLLGACLGGGNPMAADCAQGLRLSRSFGRPPRPGHQGDHTPLRYSLQAAPAPLALAGIIVAGFGGSALLLLLLLGSPPDGGGVVACHWF